jgi:hypothetical protein
MPIDGKRPPNSRNFTAGANPFGRTDPAEGESVATAKLKNAGLEVYRYPTEVGSIQYPHFVMFYISKRDGDRSATEQAAPRGSTPVDFSRQNRPEQKAGPVTIAALTAIAGAEALADVVDKGSNHHKSHDELKWQELLLEQLQVVQRVPCWQTIVTK